MNWMVSTDLSIPTTSSWYFWLEPFHHPATAMSSPQCPALPHWAAAHPRPNSRMCSASSLRSSIREGVLGAQSCQESQCMQQWVSLAGWVPLEARSGVTGGARGSSRSYVPAAPAKPYFWRGSPNYHSPNEIPKLNLSCLNPYLHK